MGKRFINGLDFLQLVTSGARVLEARVEQVNSLNIFPVPDGDTGTNMNMTLASGIEQLAKQPAEHIGKAAEIFSKGLLMGARGNSGVILSQIFRGFAKSVGGYKEIGAVQFAQALQQGVDTAYSAVMKPVEGTILTVSREAAKHGLAVCRRTDDLAELLAEVLNKAREELLRTPSYLPVLRQAGVVDSGGQGLVFILEGFASAAKGEALEHPAAFAVYGGRQPEAEASVRPAPVRQEAMIPQESVKTEDIRFYYDMEFFIRLASHGQWDEQEARRQLARMGDSILLVPDDELVKVHIHAEKPGDVLNFAIQFGELTNIHIQNMRDQHREYVRGQKAHVQAAEDGPAPENEQAEERRKRYGLVAVATGTGLHRLFQSLGADVVLSGGQTMNPSTEDIISAAERVKAETVFVFPNNSNIILAAQQAGELMNNRIVVIPTRSVPEGMAAMLKFSADASLEENAAAMRQAAQNMKSGQVTSAVRDSEVDGVAVKKDDFIAIYNHRIVAADREMLTACQHLLAEMVAEDDEVLTVFIGENASDEETEKLLAYIAQAYPHVETEVLEGGQPLYHYIFAAE